MALLSHQEVSKVVYHSYKNTTHKNKLSDVEIYAQDIRGVRYISFPGTNIFSFQDWIRNLNILPYQDNNYKGKVRLHKGYYLGYRSIQDKILELSDTNLYLVFGGHSAGGCLAQIAGVDVNFRLNKQVEVVTFGSPSCGNEYWKQSADKRIVATNYRNFLDGVPYLLFWNHLAGDNIENQLIYNRPHDMKNYIKSLTYL